MAVCFGQTTAMIEIQPIDVEHEIEKLLSVIRASFLTVAQEFNLTQANAPTNAAFLTMEALKESIAHALDFYVAKERGDIIGCVGIQPGKHKGDYYIERLAVLPKYRHHGVGTKLLAAAILEIRHRNAKRISIGIINENRPLKEWYEKHGFREYDTKTFDHLPFTVCLMSREFV